MLSSRRDEMVGRSIGRKRNSQRKRNRLPSISGMGNEGKRRSRNVELDDVRSSLL